MSSTVDIAAEKYVSLTTYTRDGSPKPLPVWIAPLTDGRLGFTTAADSWKAKRLANDPRITLRPCDQRGRVTDDAPEVSGTAVVVQGEEFDRVRAQIADKYGLWVTLMSAISTVRGWFTRSDMSSDAAVVITLDD